MKRYAPLFLLVAAPAQAQLICGPTAAVEKDLAERFNETVALEADHLPGITWQLFVSKDMKSGTIVLKRQDGLSCITEALDNIRPAAKEQKKPQPKKDITL